MVLLNSPYSILLGKIGFFMILETDRLVIRKFLETDVEALFGILGNEEVMRFSLKGPLNIKEIEESLSKILEHYNKYGFGLYALIHKESNILIGFAGFKVQLIDGEQKVELGYRLSPQYWGKGLASEAVRALSQYAFNQIKLSEFIAIIEPENIKSVQVATRLGMHLWKKTFFHQFAVDVYLLMKNG